MSALPLDPNSVAGRVQAKLYRTVGPMGGSRAAEMSGWLNELRGRSPELAWNDLLSAWLKRQGGATPLPVQGAGPGIPPGFLSKGFRGQGLIDMYRNAYPAMRGGVANNALRRGLLAE